MRYMTPDQLAEALSHVEYRHPNVAIAIFTHPYEGYGKACLAVSFTVPNAYKQGEAQKQNVNVPIPPIINFEHFCHWLRWRMETIALHELNELFWVDGKPMLDPHSETYWQIGTYVP